MKVSYTETVEFEKGSEAWDRAVRNILIEEFPGILLKAQAEAVLTAVTDAIKGVAWEDDREERAKRRRERGLD